MSCDTSARQAQACMGAAGVPEPASRAVWGGAGRCEVCGAFVAADEACRNPNCARGVARTRLGATEAAVTTGAGLGLADPLNNEVVAAMYGRYASVVSREDREVRLRPGGGFSTDLQGRIDVDPRPLGPSAPVEDQIIVTWGGIEHELAHEAWTPRWLLEAADAVARGETDTNGAGGAGHDLSPAARGCLKHWLNVIEDGRVERLLRGDAPGAFKRIRASDLLEPRWDEVVGEGVPLHHQVIGAALYEALPNFALRPEVYRGMADEARVLFDRIRPVLRRGVQGDARDALRAAVETVTVLDEAGVLGAGVGIPATVKIGPCVGSPQADGDARPVDGGEPLAPVNRPKRRDARGNDAGPGGPRRCPDCGSFVADHGVCSRCGTAAGEEPGRDGRPTGGRCGDASSGAGSGAASRGAAERAGGGAASSEPGRVERGGDRDSWEGEADGAAVDERRPVERDDSAREEVEDVLSELRSEAARAYATAMDGYAEETAKREAQRVHDGKKHVRVRYADGSLVELDLATAKPPDPAEVQRIQEFRTQYAGAARRFSRELRAIKTEVEADRRLQRRGRFDRRRMKAAVKGDRRVYRRRGADVGRDMAVAVQVDRSSSMRYHDVRDEGTGEWRRSRPVEDAATAVAVTSMALEQSQIPYEIRSFQGAGEQGRQCVHKAFTEARASDRQLAQLLRAGGSTPMQPAVELTRASLSARQEEVKLAFVLADGQPTPSRTTEAVRDAFDAMEAQGITPLLVFTSPGEIEPPMRAQLDRVAGPGRWHHVRSPALLHQVVSERIRDVYRNARRRPA